MFGSYNTYKYTGGVDFDPIFLLYWEKNEWN